MLGNCTWSWGVEHAARIIGAGMAAAVWEEAVAVQDVCRLAPDIALISSVAAGEV